MLTWLYVKEYQHDSPSARRSPLVFLQHQRNFLQYVPHQRDQADVGNPIGLSHGATMPVLG
jgi:hypothetical protein